MLKGNYSSAIPFLKDFSSSDLLLEARAKSLLGDAYMDQEDFATAASYYEKAASHKPNKEFTPIYLMKAALAYSLNGDTEKAIQKYDKVINDYKNTPEYNNARKHKAMLENKG
jgi:TolA-binding protein